MVCKLILGLLVCGMQVDSVSNIFMDVEKMVGAFLLKVREISGTILLPIWVFDYRSRDKTVHDAFYGMRENH